MTSVEWRIPLHSRLRADPNAEWRGGRFAETDILTLREAEEQATLHAGTPVTVADFLRAAARGEIRLVARCPREVVMMPTGSGDEPLKIPEGALPTLPLSACKELAAGEVAKWREYEWAEPHESGPDGFAWFVRYRLADGEPSLEIRVADCRVQMTDVAALADATIAHWQSRGPTRSESSRRVLWLGEGEAHIEFSRLAHRIADAIHPSTGPDDERLDGAFARVQLEKELKHAAEHRRLSVLNPIDFGPHTFPHGAQLDSALVSPEEVQRYLDETRPSAGIKVLRRRSAAAAPEEATLPIRRPVMATNRERILVALRHAGFDPGALPPFVNGRACAAKKAAREGAMLGESAFKHAWRELSELGELRRP